MSVQSLVGHKIDQTQGFLETGKRIPLSRINVEKTYVTQIKSLDKDGYSAVQIATGDKKNLKKPQQGHIKKAGIKNKPRFFRESRLGENSDQIKTGDELSVSMVFQPGDKVNVTGVSKGKGFAGVVKRHGFAGGPRTHGQSDRERAPGSIGASTTPGRVLKGKKMAGRMGNEQVTIKNLEVVDIEGEVLIIKGLIPGAKGSLVKITKVGSSKNFVPIYKKESEQKESTESEEDKQVKEENEESSQVEEKEKQDSEQSEKEEKNEKEEQKTEEKGDESEQKDEKSKKE